MKMMEREGQTDCVRLSGYLLGFPQEGQYEWIWDVWARGRQWRRRTSCEKLQRQAGALFAHLGAEFDVQIIPGPTIPLCLTLPPSPYLCFLSSPHGSVNLRTLPEKVHSSKWAKLGTSQWFVRILFGRGSLKCKSSLAHTEKIEGFVWWAKSGSEHFTSVIFTCLEFSFSGGKKKKHLCHSSCQ